MTDVNEAIDRLRELEAKATPGPWEWTEKDEYIYQGSFLGETLIVLDDTYEGAQEDCRLIAEMRNALPELLDHIDTLRTENAALRRDLGILYTASHLQACDLYTDERAEIRARWGLE